MCGALVDLNGRWIDVDANGSPEITITHDRTANTVHAAFSEARHCRDSDGTLLEETALDFKGRVDGDRVEGVISVCNFGRRAVRKGWVLEPLELTVSDDGTSLAGRFYCSLDHDWVAVTLLRQSPIG
jgi:hypothetical protein